VNVPTNRTAGTNVPSAADAGQYAIGGQLSVNRLGFGARRITGQGAWGQPDDPDECLATLRMLPELGINLVDTADSYGPEISEDLIADALFPYKNILVTTKNGQVRPDPESWVPVGKPEFIMQQIKMSMRRLRVDHFDLWFLHRIDRSLPRADQFAFVRSLQRDGMVRFIGLSEVDVDDIEAASAYFPVSVVQNQYNLKLRKYDGVIDYCADHDIAFMPWTPLGGGQLAGPTSPLANLAAELRATPAQLAIAWLLHRSPTMVVTPGTSRRDHLQEFVRAASLHLDAHACREIEKSVASG
jgi:aryl-alcohol dehydrogenase-like predicted oxidoreductase